MKAIPERRFRRFLRMIRDKNCTWTTTGSNEHAIWYKGNIIARYAVWHSKGCKREVGTCYVKHFIKTIDGLKDAEFLKGEF